MDKQRYKTAKANGSQAQKLAPMAMLGAPVPAPSLQASAQCLKTTPFWIFGFAPT
jgi:hypothetical protein